MPEIDDIKRAASELLVWAEGVSLEDASLQDRLVQNYSRQASKAILEIFRAYESEDEKDFDLLDFLERRLLKMNWNLVKGTVLGYTALPNHPVTTLLCDVARFVADKKAVHTTSVAVPALAVLMPGISLESIYDSHDYPCFDETTDIARVLQTHILDYQNRALLPVRLLTDIETSEHRKALINPYFNTEVGGAMSVGTSLEAIGRLSEQSVLTPDEIERLSEHSELTRAVLSAKNYYEVLSSDKSNLLGHLTQLCRHLALNNAYSGVGSHESAGAGAYPAIIAFSTYYETLGDEKSRIPAPLQLEIKKMLDFSSDRAANARGTQSFETCIANIRLDLLRAMQGNEDLLSQIGVIAGDVKIGLLAKAKANFIAAKQALKAALDAPLGASSSYRNGHDLQGLTRDLLQEFGFRLSFESPKDLEMLKLLKAEEITSIMADADLQKQFVTEIESIDNLVIFSLEIAPEKLRELLKATGRELFIKLIKTPLDLAALLISLDPERCEVVCEALKERIRKVVKTRDDLEKLIQHLRPELWSALLMGMKRQTDWYCKFYLPEGKRQIESMVKSAMENSEPLINSQDFYNMLNWVIWTIEHHEDAGYMARDILNCVHRVLKDYPDREREISALMENMKNFASRHPDVDKLCASVEDNTFYINTKEPNYPYPSLLKMVIDQRRLDLAEKLIRKGAEWKHGFSYENTLLHCELGSTAFFKKLLDILPRDEVYAVLTDKKKYWKSRNGTLLQHASSYMETYEVILDWLPKDELSEIHLREFSTEDISDLDPDYIMKLHRRLPSFIETRKDLTDLMQTFLVKGRLDFLDDIKDRIIRLIRTGNDLEEVIKNLKTRDYAQYLGGYARYYYKKPYDFVSIIKEAMGEVRFAALIQRAKGLSVVLRYATPDMRLDIYTAMQSKIPAMIITAQHFNDIYECLSMPERTAVFSAITLNHFASLMQRSEDLKIIPNYLESVGNLGIFNVLEKRIPSLVETVSDLNIFLKYCPPDMHPRIYQALQGKIPAMINSPEDIDAVCEHLLIEERRAVFSAMVDRLPQIISSSPEGASARWSKVCACLDDEQSERMLLAVQEKLPSMLNTEDDLFRFIEHLGQDKCGIVIDALIRKVPGIFPVSECFSLLGLGKLSHKLSSEQFTIALGAIKIRQDLPSGGYTHTFFLEQSLPLIERSKWVSVLTILWPIVARDSVLVHDSRNKGFGRLFKSISSLNFGPEEFTALFRGLGPGMCSAMHLGRDLESLPPTQRAAALIAIVKSDPSLILTVDHYGILLGKLPNEDVVKTIHALLGLISNKISGPLDLLKAFLSSLTPEGLTDVLSNMMVYIVPLIKTKDDLKTIGNYFNHLACDSNRYIQLLSNLFAIEERSVGSNDRKLSAYVADAKTRIRDLDRPGVFEAINEEFSTILRSVASPEVSAVKQYVEELRQKRTHCTTLFKSNCMKKAQSIESALCDMDLLSRGTVVTGGQNPVKTAISTGRISGIVNPLGLVKVEQILAQLRAPDAPARAPGAGRSAH